MAAAKKRKITDFFRDPSTSSDVDLPNDLNNNKQVPETRKSNHLKFRNEWREDPHYKLNRKQNP